jgi:hypothetical protein
MQSRPCRPSEDLKSLWQNLLPGTDFPGCGVDDKGAQAERPERASKEDALPAPAGKDAG